MSDDNRRMSVPRGWKVEQPGFDPRHQGSVGVLRRADKESLRLARRNLREIDEQDIEVRGCTCSTRRPARRSRSSPRCST
jgi:hypothetical protein